MASDVDAVAKAVQELGGHRIASSVTITIHFQDGSRQETFFPANVLATATVGTVIADNPTSIDDAIMRVISSMAPGALMSGAEIADRAGRPCSGTFASRLTAMARNGQIRCEGRRGYGPIQRT